MQGEATIAPLMQSAGKEVEFFRFPFNHTGDTEQKHAEQAGDLAGRGYRLAPCTLENIRLDVCRSLCAHAGWPRPEGGQKTAEGVYGLHGPADGVLEPDECGGGAMSRQRFCCSTITS